MESKKRKAVSDVVARSDKKARATKTPQPIETRVPPVNATDTSKSVLNTVELLEAILVHLPVKDIFKSQMICRQFRDVVTSSTQLKRKVFYLMSNREESWDLCTDRPITSQRDQLGARLLLVPHSGKSTNVVNASLKPTRLCPLLHISYGDDEGVFSRLRGPRHCDVVELTVRTVHRTRGSWRAMHLTDPPCTRITVDWANVTITGMPVVRDAVVSNVQLEVASGVTLGDLVDAVCTSTSTRAFDKQTRRKSLGAGTIDELHERFKAERGRSDELEMEGSIIRLLGMFIPSEEEWTEMEEKGVLQEKD